MKIIDNIALLLLFTTTASMGLETRYIPEEPKTENDWTKWIIANVPQFKEFVFDKPLIDRSRPDMRNPQYVVEVDWGTKWKEGVGQAVYYREVCNRKGMVLLLYKTPVDTDTERMAVQRARIACKGADVHLLLFDCTTKKFFE